MESPEVLYAKVVFSEAEARDYAERLKNGSKTFPFAYTYLAFKELGLSAGDLVVVESTKTSWNLGFVVDFAEPTQTSFKLKLKWVVDKVELSSHETRLLTFKENRDGQ